MGFLSNKSVDKWREWVKEKKFFLGEDCWQCVLLISFADSVISFHAGSNSHLYSDIKSNHLPLVPAHLM